MALEEPSQRGRPVSQWGLIELTDEVIKRGIVSRISRSSLGSFLKHSDRAADAGKAPQDSGLAQP